MFQLNFVDSNLITANNEVTHQIVLGKFTEQGISSLTFWSIEDYLANWKWACQRLLKGNEKTFLITSLEDPKHANFFMGWSLYRVNESVKVHNQILSLKQPFTSFESLFDSIEDYEYDPEVSEWSVPYSEVEAYYQTIHLNLK